jgi:pimeloyl-ACP methyl ester carboxylesterase
MLAIPKKSNNKTSPILSFQHGTRFDNDNRPSNAASKNPISIANLAGVGYITSAPDYMGYGKSLGHSTTPPYIHFQSYVNASIDMLRASKAFLKKNKIAFNKQLFLAGYSEGGYATLALQKGIQEQFKSEFIVTASAAGAGPYDLKETAKFIAKKTNNEKPSFMSYVIKSYNDIYSLNAVDEIYQQQYVKAVNTVFDAKHTGGQINKSLTSNTKKLFKPAFLAALRGETGSHPIVNKIAENNIFDWKPESPTLLFHSKYDEVVPYLNSEHAHDAMQQNNTQNLTFERCGLSIVGTHVVCALPFIKSAKSFFNNYNPEL